MASRLALASDNQGNHGGHHLLEIVDLGVPQPWIFMKKFNFEQLYLRAPDDFENVQT